MSIFRFTNFFFSLFVIVSGHVLADDRGDEIKDRMWNQAEAVFSNTEVPDKWKTESAVILAQLNRFEYKKPAIVNELYSNRYFHNRVKIIDNNALNKYSEIKFLSESGRRLKVYTGFRVIKANGTVVEVDTGDAVEMEQEDGGSREAYMKLAIPNLEVGDILDYYICEDRFIPLSSNIFYFNPVQFHLPQEYPVVSQRLEFNVQRRCFISLRSINGAPELQVEHDEANDEQNYILVDNDREAIKDIRWFYPFRELPAIKFRAAYASGKAVRQNDVLLGEPGVVKKEVSKQELADFVSYLLINTYRDPKDIIKYVKKNVDKNAGNFDKAKAGYYFQRNQQLQWDEVRTIADKDEWNQNLGYIKDNRIQFLDRMSGFLATMDIPYEIVITVPRDESSLEDVLLEPELRYLLRVKEGDEWLYLSEIDNFTVPGEIESDLQGADAYVVDGLANFKDWQLKKIKLPVTNRTDNLTEGLLEVSIEDDFSRCNVGVTRKITGVSKLYHQYVLLDFYDYKSEESSKYEMKENFEGTLWMKNRLINLRESYLSNRTEVKNDYLKQFIEDEYEFEIENIADLQITQTGRYENNPEMIYQFSMESEDLIGKVGSNYMLNVGKLIETQVKIPEEELERKHGIYQNSPRSYNYKISIDIPQGYEVQGLDKLTMKVETSQGGFVSSAVMADGNLVIETTKYYSNIFAGKEAWPDLVKFLNAASDFTEQKVLLRKSGEI